jgi:hypothetical protein
MPTHPFLQSGEFSAITEKTFFRNVLADVPADSIVMFDLTFHAAFAKRMFDIMKREGPAVQGFDRMQQSFLESVNTIRVLLAELEERYSIDTKSFIENPASLTVLIGDLAIMKNWQMKNNDNTEGK